MKAGKFGIFDLLSGLSRSSKRRASKLSLRSPSEDYLVHYEPVMGDVSASGLSIILQQGEAGFICCANGLPVKLEGPIAVSATDYVSDDDIEGVFFICRGEKLSSKFGVPFFEVFDGVHKEVSVGLAARGEYLFTIDDPDDFVRKNRLRHFELRAFSRRLQDAVSQRVKSVLSNLPLDQGISVLQLERQLDRIAALIAVGLVEEVSEDFGVQITRFRVSALEPEKGSPNYDSLIRMTRDSAERLHDAKLDKQIEEIREPRIASSVSDGDRERIDF